MKKATLLTLGSVLVAGCLLAGCAKKAPPPGLDSSTINGSNDTAAQTYGMNNQNGYQSSTDADGKIINSMTAPSDQTYYFDFDSNNVNTSDYAALNVQANYLASHPGAKVRLEGNTDNRGSREYNIGLGWRRDQAVARLMEQQGVRPKQIDMVSYGKERPAVSGDNEHDWQLNRRVHLVYEAK